MITVLISAVLFLVAIYFGKYIRKYSDEAYILATENPS